MSIGCPFLPEALESCMGLKNFLLKSCPKEVFFLLYKHAEH